MSYLICKLEVSEKQILYNKLFQPYHKPFFTLFLFIPDYITKEKFQSQILDMNKDTRKRIEALTNLKLTDDIYSSPINFTFWNITDFNFCGKHGNSYNVITNPDTGELIIETGIYNWEV